MSGPVARGTPSPRVLFPCPVCGAPAGRQCTSETGKPSPCHQRRPNVKDMRAADVVLACVQAIETRQQPTADDIVSAWVGMPACQEKDRLFREALDKLRITSDESEIVRKVPRWAKQNESERLKARRAQLACERVVRENPELVAQAREEIQRWASVMAVVTDAAFRKVEG